MNKNKIKNSFKKFFKTAVAKIKNTTSILKVWMLVIAFTIALVFVATKTFLPKSIKKTNTPQFIPTVAVNTPYVTETPKFYEPRFFKDDIIGRKANTTNWKTFSISDLNFSIKIPPDWKIQTWKNYDFLSSEEIHNHKYLLTAHVSLDGNEYFSNDDASPAYFNVSYKLGNEHFNYQDVKAGKEFNLNSIKGVVYEGHYSLEEFFTFLDHTGRNAITIEVGMGYGKKAPEPILSWIKDVVSTISVGRVNDSFLYFENWRHISDETNSFSVYAPATFTKTSEREISLHQWGPTQISDTEGYDLFNVVIRLVEKVQDVKVAVENHRIEFIDGDVDRQKNTSEVKEISFGSMRGYYYTYDGYGTFDQILVKTADSKKYFEIQKSIQDGAGQGFEDTVHKILSSLR